MLSPSLRIAVHAFLLVLYGALGVACTREDGERGSPPVERFAHAWSVDAHGGEPLFRPADIAVVGACQIWVPDAGIGRVLRWECDGREAPAIGRKGEGPGEFGQPSAVIPLGGDSAAAWDGGLERLSSFAADGRFLGSRTARLSPGEHGFVRTLSIDGSRLLVAAERFPGMQPGDSSIAFVWVVDEAGKPTRASLREPGPQVLVAWDGMLRASTNAPFARETRFVFLRDGRILAGETGSGRMTLVDRAGGAQGDTIDLGISPPAVTADERARWTDSMLRHIRAEVERAGIPSPQREAVLGVNERLVAGAPFPATRNAYLLIVQDDEGHLWVQRDLVLPAGGSRWEVHALDDGRLLRVIDVPTRGRVRAAAVASGALYVVEMDADDQGHVSRYAPAAPR